MLTNNDRPITIESIIEKTDTLPSLPLFYDRLNEKINHPRSSLADIGQVIGEDQGLTVRLLKLANSPLYGYQANIDSITRALTLIGIQQLRDLALAVSVMGSFSVPSADINMKSFWKHNIACGILARNIATYRREFNQERFFVSGMLHDVGVLVMYHAIPDVAREIRKEAKNRRELNYVTERKLLGFEHGGVGSSLLAKWKIPLNIAEPVARHHSPDAALKYPLETATIHLADIICHTMEYGLTGDGLIPPVSDTAWSILDISVNKLDTIIKHSETQIEETFTVMTEGA